MVNSHDKRRLFLSYTFDRTTFFFLFTGYIHLLFWLVHSPYITNHLEDVSSIRLIISIIFSILLSVFAIIEYKEVIFSNNLSKSPSSLIKSLFTQFSQKQLLLIITLIYCSNIIVLLFLANSFESTLELIALLVILIISFKFLKKKFELRPTDNSNNTIILNFGLKLPSTTYVDNCCLLCHTSQLEKGKTTVSICDECNSMIYEIARYHSIYIILIPLIINLFISSIMILIGSITGILGLLYFYVLLFGIPSLIIIQIQRLRRIQKHSNLIYLMRVNDRIKGYSWILLLMADICMLIPIFGSITIILISFIMLPSIRSSFPYISLNEFIKQTHS